MTIKTLLMMDISKQGGFISHLQYNVGFSFCFSFLCHKCYCGFFLLMLGKHGQRENEGEYDYLGAYSAYKVTEIGLSTHEIITHMNVH